MLTETLIKKAVEENNTPVYLYDCQRIQKNISNLAQALPEGSKLYYSMKANPLLGICQCIKQYISDIEVSSFNEMQVALKAGFSNEGILFSGPGKRHEELYEAVNAEVKINVESIQEINIIIRICEFISKKAKIMVRINPKITNNLAGIKMSGLSSQFGIDYSDIEEAIRIIVTSRWLVFVGFSIYMGSQILNADTIVSNTCEIVKLCIGLKKKYSLHIKELDVGGGFGVSYYDEKQLELNMLRNGLNNLLQKHKNDMINVKISFESGRYLIADCGLFITKVLYIKSSKDRTYIICDGGFNNALLVSFFTKEVRGNFPIELIKNRSENISDDFFEYYISGPLCTPADMLGIKVSLPAVESGDYILIRNVGAYGLTYSPTNFISHIIPAEVLVNNNKIHVARKRSGINDLLRGQNGIPNDFFECRLPIKKEV